MTDSGSQQNDVIVKLVYSTNILVRSRFPSLLGKYNGIQSSHRQEDATNHLATSSHLATNNSPPKTRHQLATKHEIHATDLLHK